MRRALKLRQAGWQPLLRLFPSTARTIHSLSSRTYTCQLDVEDLQNYKKGGHHPVHLGDTFKHGRYKIIDKLGNGAYSTVWAARDQSNKKIVAIKFEVAERSSQNRESAILSGIAAKKSRHLGYQHIRTLHDCFQLDGPNGIHNCLVLEVLGPSVADWVQNIYDGYCPPKLSDTVAKQALLGLSYLHSKGIGHGDLHLGNLAFTAPRMQGLQEEEFSQLFGKPKTAPVKHLEGKPLEAGVPRYLVEPAPFPTTLFPSIPLVKIIDFGQAFWNYDGPHSIQTPLCYRSPEIIFKDKVDYRMDLWSMGCMLFQLFALNPAFDSIGSSSAYVVSQMVESLTDELPDRWQVEWQAMKQTDHVLNTPIPIEYQEPPHSLEEWFESDDNSLGKHDMRQMGAMISSLLRFEPDQRASARDTLLHYWSMTTKAERVNTPAERSVILA